MTQSVGLLLQLQPLRKCWEVLGLVTATLMVQLASARQSLSGL